MRKLRTFGAFLVAMLFCTAVFNPHAFDTLENDWISEAHLQPHVPQNNGASRAEKAIEAALKAIQKANQTLIEASAEGVNITRAEFLLNQSIDTLEQARSAYEDGDYREALFLAIRAKSMAKMAEWLVRIPGGIPEFGDDQEKALDAIVDAEEAIAMANETIIEASEHEVNVTKAERLLRRAIATLNSSKSAFENCKYHEALHLANVAQSLAEKARESAEKALEGIEEAMEGREVALNAIASAEEAIDAANQTIVNAQQMGINVTEAEVILNRSVTALSAALEAFEGFNFELTSELADESRELAEDAKDAAEHAVEEFKEKARVQDMKRAQEAIEDAKESMLEANETIASMMASGVDVSIAESLLIQANNILCNATDAFDKGYYEVAINLAREARDLSGMAMKFAESAQSELCFETLQVIAGAEGFVKSVKDYLVSVQHAGLNLTEEIMLLNSSFSCLSEAWKEFNVWNLTGAKKLAEEARQLAESARSSAEKSFQAFESGRREAVQGIIDEAEKALSKFEGELEELSSRGLNVTVCISVFEVANITLQLAKYALYDGEFDKASDLAEGVLDMVDNGLKLLSSLSASPVSELEYREDKEGVLVCSSVGNLSMSYAKPSVTFGYRMNDTSLDFGLDFLSVAEFFDVNHDNIVQENEVLQVLRFEDSIWDKTLRVYTIDDNQILSVTYRTVSPYYDVRLEIQLFKYPMVFSTSVDDTIVVFDVRGAAMGAKINIEVNKWPWTSSSSELGLNLLMDMGTSGTVFENSTFQGNLAQISINMSNAIVVAGWLTKAKLIDPKGAESFAEVGVGYVTEMDEAGMKLSLSFIYPNFKGFTMNHDPTIDVRLTPTAFVYAPLFSRVWLSIGSATMVSFIAFWALLSTRRGRGGRPSKRRYSLRSLGI